MVIREELLALDFYKSRPFKGSDTGIRYMVKKDRIKSSEESGEEKDVLVAYIWPEPFCFEATSEELKQSQDFPFSEEGLCQAIAWINENHDRIIIQANMEDK